MTKELSEYEVVVVGAGSAGATAALAASQSGARTLLIDRLPFAGGTSTGVLDTFYGFYTPGEVAKKVVGGIPDQVVTELKKLGPVVERPNTYGAGTGVTYNPEHLKVAGNGCCGKATVTYYFTRSFMMQKLKMVELPK